MKKIDGVRVAVRRILKEEDAAVPQAQTKTELIKDLDVILDRLIEKGRNNLFRGDNAYIPGLQEMFKTRVVNKDAAAFLMTIMEFIPGLSEQRFVIWWKNSKFGTNEDRSSEVTDMLTSTFESDPGGDAMISDRAKRAILVGIDKAIKFMTSP